MGSTLGFWETLGLILLGFLWSYVLGRYLLGVRSQWQSQSRTHRFLFYILFGLRVVLCTLGLLTLVVPLECSQIIYFLPQSTLSA